MQDTHSVQERVDRLFGQIEEIDRQLMTMRDATARAQLHKQCDELGRSLVLLLVGLHKAGHRITLTPVASGRPSSSDRQEVAAVDPAALLAELLASVPLQDRPVLEFEVLCACINHSARWDGLGPKPRLVFLSFLVARLRYLQDERGVAGGDIRWVFGRMHGYSRSRRPGPINGLARAHVPQHGSSWGDDVAFYLGQLTAEPA